MIALTVTLFFTIILLPLYIKFLLTIKKVQFNYKNEKIPYSFGLFIVLLELFMIILLNQKELFYFWALFLIALIGTYDDYYGDKKTKGFKGHFYALTKGTITSGFLKAFGTAGISFFLSIQISGNFLSLFSNLILLVFMTNTINLFDLRPGRAIKMYFILISLLAIFSPIILSNSFSLIQVSIIGVVFFYDIRAKIMLGDSGSNLLGFHLGLLYSLYLQTVGKWLFIFIIIGINVYSERNSISKFIDQHQWLRSIDQFGRKGMG